MRVVAIAGAGRWLRTRLVLGEVTMCRGVRDAVEGRCTRQTRGGRIYLFSTFLGSRGDEDSRPHLTQMEPPCPVAWSGARPLRQPAKSATASGVFGTQKGGWCLIESSRDR